MRSTIISLMILASSFSTDLLAQSDLSACHTASIEIDTQPAALAEIAG